MSHATQQTLTNTQLNMAMSHSYDSFIDCVDESMPSILTPGVGYIWHEHQRRILLIDRLVYQDGWPTVAGGIPSTTAQAGPRTE